MYQNLEKTKKNVICDCISRSYDQTLLIDIRSSLFSFLFNKMQCRNSDFVVLSKYLVDRVINKSNSLK